MSLIKCEECGNEISDMATSCPHCGCPIEEEQEEEKNGILYNVISITLGIFSWIIALKINAGLLLIIPFAIFLFNMWFTRETSGFLSWIADIISGLGIGLLLLDFLKPILFTVLSFLA